MTLQEKADKAHSLLNDWTAQEALTELGFDSRFMQKMKRLGLVKRRKKLGFYDQYYFAVVEKYEWKFK